MYIFVKPGIVSYPLFYWNQYTKYYTADRNKKIKQKFDFI